MKRIYGAFIPNVIRKSTQLFIIYTLDVFRFLKNILYLQMKELFDSTASQNAEIRTVAKSLPLLFLK